MADDKQPAVEQALGRVLAWWASILAKAGVPSRLSTALVLHAQGRPSRFTAAARRQLVACMLADVPPELVRRWLGVTTSLSRKTLDTLVPRAPRKPGRPRKGETPC